MNAGIVPTNDGLDPTPGSDLLDLVASSELTPDVVDTLRSRAGGILDAAISVLFKSDREVADGRRAYDELTNLGRALRLADQKWSKTRSRGSTLHEHTDRLEAVAPLYACVAMVPGEMSASVKNFATAVGTLSHESTSWSSRTGEATGFSLLTLGMSQSESSSCSSSQSSSTLHYETSTIDRRVMPVLHELKVQLDRLTIADGMLVLPRQRDQGF